MAPTIFSSPPRVRFAGIIAFGTLLFLSCTSVWSSQAQAPPAQIPYWIWSPGPARPPETVFFRHRFKLAAGFTSAKLAITADNGFKITINEGKRPQLQGADWTTIREYDVTRYLKAGDNLFAIECLNTGGDGGLIYRLTVHAADGQTVTIVSNGEVRSNRSVPPTWTLFAVDDSKWQRSREEAPANAGPWGQLYGPVQPDPGHMVRLWDFKAGGKTGDNPYTRARSIGDRMILSTNATSSAEMLLLGQCGFTLFQTDSDHLSTEEIRANLWDFTQQETSRLAVQKLGFDWCYFPHEAFPPAWYRQATPFTRLQCLEDKLPVEAFSIWDPLWPQFIDHGYSAIERQFAVKPVVVPARPAPKLPAKAPTTSVSSIYVGVHGDYGECGLMMGARVNVPGQKEDWQARFGNLHDHLGWWCHDPLARADFRAAMLQKYGGLPAINSAWKRSFKAPEEIVYPSAPRAEARREWLDFVQWYDASVGKAIDMNLNAARKYFPDSLLMLPAGFADENPRGGNDNSLIPKLAARVKADVRSTHGAFHPFAENSATMYGRLGSACRFYDVPFWSEPPTIISANQEVERIFEAVSQGSKGHFDWTSNALKFRDVYLRYGKFLRVSKPIVDVAMFYPAEAQKTRPSEGYANLFAQACGYVRDIANFDIVDDRMVLDGALANYRILTLWEGTMCDQATLDKIRAWVNDGGVLLAYDFGKVTNFEGDAPWYADDSDMFGYIQHLTPAQIRERYIGAVPLQYRIAVADPNSPTAADYLADGGDGWYAPELVDGLPRRWTRASAGVLLPVNPETEYTLIVRAYVPPGGAGKRRTVSVNDHEVGEMGSVGDVTYRFVLPAAVIGGQKLSRVTFKADPINLPGDSRSLGVQVQYVQLVQRGEEENARAPLPLGRISRELDFARLKTDWTRKLGKGLTIYFPANKRLLKGYIEVLRRAIYRLSEIEPGRTEALPIDDSLDGLYTTLFTDQILYYNSRDKAVTKTVRLDPDRLEAWKGQITMPKENTWTITVPAHGIEAIRFAPGPEEMIFECEDFLQLNNLKPLAASECSPGTGKSCVVIPKGSEISTTVQIETPGAYAVFTRCTRGGRPDSPEVLADDQVLKGSGTLKGQTILSGIVTLGRGKHTITLRARDRDVRADFIALTNDPTVGGYDFYLRRPAFEAAPAPPR